MNDQLKQWQDETMPADEFWGDIVAHGANSGGAISDKGFADGMAAIAGITQQMKKKPVSKKASKRGKSNQKKGKAGEKKAMFALQNMGHLRVVGIPTPKVYVMVGGGMWRLVRTDRAPGDINSMDASGFWCLSEVKNYDHDRLQWSALTRQTKAGTYHQSENLDQHLGYSPNVSAFIIWVRGKETAVLSWPIDGFKKGTSILWADALEMRVNK